MIHLKIGNLPFTKISFSSLIHYLNGKVWEVITYTHSVKYKQYTAIIYISYEHPLSSYNMLYTLVIISDDDTYIKLKDTQPCD